MNRITINTRSIAIEMLNNNSVNANWATYFTTADAIEQATGYDLL